MAIIIKKKTGQRINHCIWRSKNCSSKKASNYFSILTTQVEFCPVGWRELYYTPTASLQRGKAPHQPVAYGPVSWGCRIHRLHLYRRVRPTLQSVSCIIWWGASGNAWILSNVKYPFIPIAPSPGPLWPGVVGSDRVLSLGQIELNWIV